MIHNKDADLDKGWYDFDVTGKNRDLFKNLFINYVIV